jgi:hypothetical protein
MRTISGRKLTRLALPRSAVTAIAIAVVGCGTEREPTSPSASLPAPSHGAAAAPRTVPPLTVDDAFAAIATTAPGFGGLFRDSTGALTMYLADMKRAPAALAAIRPFLTRQHLMDGVVHIRHGAYDYRQLVAWKQRLIPVLALPGTVFTDVDEATNRLRVGVEDL